MKVKYLQSMLKLMVSVAIILVLTSPAIHAEEPQYGGTLKVYPVYPHIPPYVWDTTSWNWTVNLGLGPVVQHLLSGDLQKGPRGTKEYTFQLDGWVPPGAVRGELAESWELKENPLRLEFNLRKGVYWQAREGVMESREFVADDVVDFYNRLSGSKKAIPRFLEFIDRWEAKGKHKVVAYLTYYNANWQYKMGWGYYDGISPKEVADAGANDWKKATGTGPFSLKEHKKGNFGEYVKNPNYWDKETIGGKAYKFPFVDRLMYLYSTDAQARLAALRTGKVDINTSIDWKYVDELKKDAPDLKWSKWLYTSPGLLAMRFDKKPFDDIRVRRAVALAINQEDIIKSYFGGNAELFTYPLPPIWPKYHIPLEQMPKDVQELYTYNPEKAKKLLKEAGYPDGFTVKCQVQSNSSQALELMQLVTAYLSKVGVTVEIVPMEYRNWLTVMIKKEHSPLYLHYSAFGNPLMVLRKNFVSGQTWNPYMMKDEKLDEMIMEDAFKTKDEEELIKKVKKSATYAMQQVPFVQLPNVYAYTAWWPWVKNYYGELRVGCDYYGPIHARVWIDQELKKKMGYD